MTVNVTLTGHTGAVYGIEYMPDGTLVTGGDDGIVNVWEPKTATKLASFNPMGSGVYSIRLISQDQVIALGGLNVSIYFYRIDGNNTPVFLKKITPSVNSLYIYSMITMNVMYNNVNSTILYAGAGYSYALSVNVTSTDNISLLRAALIDSTNTFLFAVEKSGK